MAKHELATFAGGCFWCMVSPFDEFPGVVKVVSGYTGGHQPNPTYEQVCAGGTGHVEAVQITYDPEILAYETFTDVLASDRSHRSRGSSAIRAALIAPQSSTIPGAKGCRRGIQAGLAESGADAPSHPICRPRSSGRRRLPPGFYKKNPPITRTTARARAGMSLSGTLVLEARSHRPQGKADGYPVPGNPGKRDGTAFPERVLG